MSSQTPAFASRESTVASTVTEALRVVIGEDDVLLREGISRLLAEGGFDVVAQAGDAEDFLRRALAHRPDVAVVDVKMPPGNTDDGLRAALELRRQRPETGILVLSQFYEEHYALELIGEHAEGVGYLLKERVGDVDAFIDASGAPQAVRSGIKAVAPAGRVILVGLDADDVELPVSFIQNREIWLSGVFRYTNTWPLAIQLIADGKVDLDILVTGRFPLAESEEALKAGKQAGQLKAVVYPGR